MRQASHQFMTTNRLRASSERSQTTTGNSQVSCEVCIRVTPSHVAVRRRSDFAPAMNRLKLRVVLERLTIESLLAIRVY